MKRLILIAVLVLALAGCLVWAKSTPEHTAYRTARLATVAAVSFEFIDLADLQAAKAPLAAAYMALGATSEAELDVAIGLYLSDYIDALDGDLDKVLIKEVIAAVLDQVALKDPDAIRGGGVARARAIIGGILDGIKAAEGE